MSVQYTVDKRDMTFALLLQQLESSIRNRLNLKMTELLPAIVEEEIAKLSIRLFDTISFEDRVNRLVITVHKDKDNL